MVRSILRILIWIIPAGIYVAIFLILDVDREAAFWTSLALLALAYVTLALSFVAVPQGRVSTILSMPLTLVASIYLGVELVAATIFISLQDIPYPWVIITQLIIAAIFLVVTFATMSSNEAMAASLETQQADVQTIKTAVARIDALVRQAKDPAVKRSLERLSEEFRYSPTMRNARVRAFDGHIAELITNLEELVQSGSPQEQIVGHIAAISGALAARNQQVSLSQ